MLTRFCTALGAILYLSSNAHAAPIGDITIDVCGQVLEVCTVTCDLARRPGFDLRYVLCQDDCTQGYDKCVGMPPYEASGSRPGQTEIPPKGVFERGDRRPGMKKGRGNSGPELDPSLTIK